MSVARRIRSLFFWIHLSIGLAAGARILLMSVTGVLLGLARRRSVPAVTALPDPTFETPTPLR